MNVFRVLHSGGTVRHIIEVDAATTTGTRCQQFQAATREAALAEIAARGLLLLDTPAKKQRHLFDQAAASNPAMVAPFLKLEAPLAALNTAGEAAGDYTAAKTMLAAVVTDSPQQAAVKAALLACYPSPPER